MAKTKHKYAKSKGGKKGKKGRGKAKKARKTTAHKAARRSKKRKHAYRGVIGGWYTSGVRRVKKPKRKAKAKKARKTKHAYAGQSNTGFAKCGRCHRVIFGGSKGMGTHRRKRHGGPRHRSPR